MIYKILIGLAALFGLFRLFRMTDTLAKAILIGQISAIGLTLLFENVLMTIGFLVYTLTLVLIIIYGLKTTFTNTFIRILIIVPSFFIFVLHIFQQQHFPGTKLLGFTMILPLVAYLILLLKYRGNLKNEFGFITIITVDAFIEFLMRIEWIMN